MKRLLVVAALAIFFAVNSFAYTIYVDSANNGDGDEDGMSWDTAWGTIAEGRNDLIATNSVEPGGHLVLVTNSGSTYAENVSLGTTVAGTSDANRNTFRGLGHPVINGSSSYSVTFNGGFLTIDGFVVVADTYAGFYIRANDVNVENCVVYDDAPDKYGFDLSGVARLKIDHCTLYGLESGIRQYTAGVEPCSIKDSIIASCGRGIYERGEFGSVSNCIFYGNGMHWGYRFTDDQLNADDDAGNNKIANPGFRMGQSYYFNRFYENNPSATHASDGGYVGAYQEADITYFGISNVTWYVSPTGDDGRTTDEAANPNTPWQTLGHAQAKATAGTTIIVKPGRYAEEVNFYRGGSHNGTTDTPMPLTFQAEVSGCATVWSSWAMFDLQKTMGVTLDGFVLDGEGNGRYGVYGSASAGNTFNDITITNLSVSTGAAFYLTGGGHVVSNANIGPNSGDGFNILYGGVTVLDSRIHDNTYGIESSGPHYVVAKRTRFYDNSVGAWNDGGYTYSSGNYVQYFNCAFYGNNYGLRSECPQASRYHYAYLFNCVMYNNTYGAYCDNYGYIFAYNTIFANNSNSGAIEEQNVSNGDFRSYNNCFWNNGVNFYSEGSVSYNDAGDIDTAAGGNSNIVVNPMFVNAAGGNFKVDLHSPVIDKGREFAGFSDDLYGNTRPIRDTWDIGVFEAGPLPAAGTIILVR